MTKKGDDSHEPNVSSVMRGIDGNVKSNGDNGVHFGTTREDAERGPSQLLNVSMQTPKLYEKHIHYSVGKSVGLLGNWKTCLLTAIV